jgi:hypothetical protein
MIKVTVYKTSVCGEYLGDIESGCSTVTVSFGSRRPGVKRIREQCSPALGEEILIVRK